MRESFARLRTCKACPDSRPDIATPAGCSSLLASQPWFPLPFLLRPFPLRLPGQRAYFRTTPCPQYRLRGLSVFRAYLNPEKPRLGANLRVSLGFWPVFWNWEAGTPRGEATDCGPLDRGYY